jgi:hypothetical protein
LISWLAVEAAEQNLQTMPNGAPPTITSTVPSEVRSALWALLQKQLFWKGDLPQHKIAMLNKVEGWTWCPVEGETWEMLGFEKKN